MFVQTSCPYLLAHKRILMAPKKMSKKISLNGPKLLSTWVRQKSTVIVVGDQHGIRGSCQDLKNDQLDIQDYFNLVQHAMNNGNHVNIFLEHLSDNNDYMDKFLNMLYSSNSFANDKIGIYNVEVRDSTPIFKYLNVLQRLHNWLADARELDEDNPLQAYKFIYEHGSTLEKGESMSSELKIFNQNHTSTPSSFSMLKKLVYDTIMMLPSTSDRQMLLDLLRRLRNTSGYEFLLIDSLTNFDQCMNLDSFKTFDQLSRHVEQVSDYFITTIVQSMAFLQDLYTVALTLLTSTGVSKSIVIVGAQHAKNVGQIFQLLKFKKTNQFTKLIGTQCLDITGYF